MSLPKFVLVDAGIVRLLRCVVDEAKMMLGRTSFLKPF